jgi:hypothetical protein
MPKKSICSVCTIAVLGLFTVAGASAQPDDKRTFFTFSGPVEVPGVALAPGKYLFRIVDPSSGGKVVQVLSADGTRPYAMFFTIPAYRLTPASETEIRFMETSADAPPAIKTWWFPGDTMGREFIYPKEHAKRLAKGTTKESVLTTQKATTKVEETKATELSYLSSSGAETPIDTNSKPTKSDPTGKAQPGEAAPASIKIKQD